MHTRSWLRARRASAIAALLLIATSVSVALGADAARVSMPSDSPAGSSATTTALSSTTNPSDLNRFVSFAATVTGQSPTGSVTFAYDGTVICNGPVALNLGVARCSMRTLEAGMHEILATYSGDQNNAASASAPLVQSVSNLLATDIIFISVCPYRTVDHDEPFTYRARLSGGSASAEGDVVFYYGENELCTVPLIDRQATCTTTALVATGNEPLTDIVVHASYLGDGTNAPADSFGYTVRIRNPAVFIFRNAFEDISATCPTQG
jgi:hypothetical protein